MGFLEFNGEYQLELFLTDRGKQKIVELNGKGLSDLLGGSLSNPSGQANGDGHFYMSDNDFNYETLETLSEGGTGACIPLVSPWAQGANTANSGQTTPSNTMPCFFGMPDVRGQRYFTTDHCTFYTGMTSLTGMSSETNVYVFYDQSIQLSTPLPGELALPKTPPPMLAAQANFYSAVTQWFGLVQSTDSSYKGKMYHFVMDTADEPNTIPSTYGGHGRYLRWSAFPAFGLLAGVKNSPPPGRDDAIASDFWPDGANWSPGDGTGILESYNPDSDVFCIFFMGSSESYTSPQPLIPASVPTGVASDWDGLTTQAGYGGDYYQDWRYFAGDSSSNWTSRGTTWLPGDISSYNEGEGALDFYKNTKSYGGIKNGNFMGLIFPISCTGGTGVNQYSSFNLHLFGALEAGNGGIGGTVSAPNTDAPNLCVDYDALTISNPYYNTDLEGPGNLKGLRNLGFIADLTKSFSTNGVNCTPVVSAMTGSNYTLGFDSSSTPPFTGHQWITGNTPFIVDTFTGAANSNLFNLAMASTSTGRTSMFKSTACTICYCLPAVFRGSTCAPIVTITTTQTTSPCPDPPCDPDPEIIRLCDGSTYSTALRLSTPMAGPLRVPVQPFATSPLIDPLQAPGWVLGYEDCMSLDVVVVMQAVAYLSSTDRVERLDYDIELNAIIPRNNVKDSLSYYWFMRESLIYDRKLQQEITVPCRDYDIEWIIANGTKTLNNRFYLNDLRKKIDNEHYWQKEVQEYCLYCVVNYNNQQLFTKKTRIRVSGDNEYGWKLSIKGS